MPRYDRFTEELLGFLLTRLDDESDLEHLVTHEPRRISAAYFEGGGGRAETRVMRFTGCAACSRIPPYTLFPSYGRITVPAWPCLPVRALALRFAGEPDYCDGWRPEVALFASGRLVHET
ncbi:hypothetical protein [Streptomyces violaceusniger]|uniref:Uncharacterized protein n=1 Tax=Streptomyces violaceusniger (strain Tu 4113) TaxID=653045 RepID=G2P7X9_STRV4|nr:hypothetical protein [Streptomyces violaceusniger]AEM85640.1 hypothetical protein Strvi_6154 [Streptomyces violaceusniger Tu 4113]